MTSRPPKPEGLLANPRFKGKREKNADNAAKSLKSVRKALKALLIRDPCTGEWYEFDDRLTRSFPVGPQFCSQRALSGVWTVLLFNAFPVSKRRMLCLTSTSRSTALQTKLRWHTP